MINFILKNKKGVTILEGVIALGLLALVTAGAFGVLLSTSRKSSETDIREEMLLSVEKAREALQVYSGSVSLPPGEPYGSGVCGGDSSPMQESVEHDIKCMLPPVCDRANSKFTYRVYADLLTDESGDVLQNLPDADSILKPGSYSGYNKAIPVWQVTFNIKCNGFTL